MRHTVHQIVAQLTAHTAHIRDEIGVDEQYVANHRIFCTAFFTERNVPATFYSD